VLLNMWNGLIEWNEIIEGEGKTTRDLILDLAAASSDKGMNE